MFKFWSGWIVGICTAFFLFYFMVRIETNDRYSELLQESDNRYYFTVVYSPQLRFAREHAKSGHIRFDGSKSIIAVKDAEDFIKICNRYSDLTNEILK